ncbi:MAG: nucleotidyltransferase family protein [Sandaracinaceae bacterium]
MSAARWTSAARLAAAVVARRDLAEAVRVLNAAGIIPMPLKGVLLQQEVYRDPGARVLSDVDLLVRPGRFGDALAALRHADYRLDAEGRTGRSARGPDASLEVDLHRRLFSPGLFRLHARHLFARGRLDTEGFGATVILPAPLDVYAHLVGNFAKGRHTDAHAFQVRDLAAVAARYRLGPAATAAHLRAHGLGRAARYALPFAAADGDAFAPRVLTALGPDPIGDGAALLARSLATRCGSSARASLLAPHLVNHTLAAGAWSCSVHLVLGARRSLLGRPDDRGRGADPEPSSRAPGVR